MALPPSAKLAAAFPNIKDARAVKQLIGGGVDDTQQGPAKEWIGNTCTVRMSRTLNYAGAPLPAHFPGMRMVKGGDGRHYAFAVLEFWKYMTATFGKPQIDVKGGAGVRAKSFGGKTGIIGFEIHFNDANGHFDLWDGTTFFDEIYGISYPGHDFFEMATRIALWGTNGAMKLTAPGGP